MAEAMRARAVELICCPSCRAGGFQIIPERYDGDELMEGTLVCDECARRFAVTRGIPRLLPERVPDDQQVTVDRFGEQWNDFSFLGPHYEQQFLGWISPNDAQTFSNKIVLEAGCGKGRHSAIVSDWGAKDVLAVDLGSAVEAAFHNTRDRRNVHVIQGDLFNLPIADGTVDVAFSVGVLHHTPDPRRCFERVVASVRPGGRMIAWVYGRENNGWIINIVNPIRNRVTSRIPHRWVYQLSKAPAAVLMAMGRGVYQPLSKPPLDTVGQRLFYQAYINHVTKFPFNEVHSIVHDHLTPSIAEYIPEAEFRDWFSRVGLANVEIGWHNENSWRGTGIVVER